MVLWVVFLVKVWGCTVIDFSLVIEKVTCTTCFCSSKCMGVEEGILKSCRISNRGFDGSELLPVSILYFPQTVTWGILIMCYVEREFMKLNAIMFAM